MTALTLSNIDRSDDRPTMSSIEMAKLTGRRHQDVLRDIRNMLEPLGLPFAQFCAKVPSAGGRPLTVAHLPRRECLILISGYSVQLRARIIDRWEQLEREAGQSLPDLSDPEVLRGLLSSYVGDKAALLEKVATQAPKVEALERLAEADGSLCITDAAKALQVQPKALFNFLRRESWIYRRAGGSNDVAYQHRVQAGYVEHKVTRLRRAAGPDRMVEQVRITPKGLTRLAQMLAS